MEINGIENRIKEISEEQCKGYPEIEYLTPLQKLNAIEHTLIRLTRENAALIKVVDRFRGEE